MSMLALDSLTLDDLRRMIGHRVDLIAALLEGYGREAGSWIYAIQADGYGGAIKVGFTGRHPIDRLTELQRGTAQALAGVAAWPGVRAEERAIHQAYSYARIRGEWFWHHLPLYTYLRERGGNFKWSIT